MVQIQSQMGVLTHLPLIIFYLNGMHCWLDYQGTFREYVKFILKHLYTKPLLVWETNQPYIFDMQRKTVCPNLIPGLFIPPWHLKPNGHVSLLKYWRWGHVLQTPIMCTEYFWRCMGFKKQCGWNLPEQSLWVCVAEGLLGKCNDHF